VRWGWRRLAWRKIRWRLRNAQAAHIVRDMKLHRVWRSHKTTGKGQALGVLYDDNARLFLTTFEDKPIPAGTYTVTLMPAAANPKHGESWEVQNIPGRTDILFHAGNDEDDSEGCILLGFGFSGRAISASQFAMGRFKRFLANVGEFTLVIADPAL
jgi:hypothetical protein